MDQKTVLHHKLAPGEFMRTKDGQMIKSLRELALVMEKLADEVFHHHVSDSKNDFAQWVREVIKDERLAEELMKSLDKEGHEKIIFRHIVRNYVKD